MKKRIQIKDIVPFAMFVVIFLFFTIASAGKMLSGYNLKIILEQSIINILAALGALFVVAQGSVDLSIGVNLAISGIVASRLSVVTGIPFLIIPLTLIFATGIGVFNGFIVGSCKVPSFMATIALLIGLRGVVNYIQSNTGIDYFPKSLAGLNEYYVKIPIFILIVIVMYFVFEHTRYGRYCKSIGENENTARCVGINIKWIKIVAFGISGLMAGVASIFSMAQLGGTSTTMGIFFEIQVCMSIYLGGVLVTGGTSARIYKVILGSITIGMISNGLVLIGLSSSEYSQFVNGCLLLVVIIISNIDFRKKREINKTKTNKEGKANV